MHELSIAVDLVDAALEEAARLELASIDAVHVEVGVLSGVVQEALGQAFEVASRGTPLQGSRLVIEQTGGRELQIVALEVPS